MVWYSQDKDALQFSNGHSREATFNFATAYEKVIEDGVTVNRYYGDSLAEYRVTIYMDLQGFTTPDERPYKLKTVLLDGQDASKVGEVRFDSYYSLSPNSLLDTVTLTLLRPKGRGDYVVNIMVDTDGDDSFFEKGVSECSVYQFNISDRYDEPNDWAARKEWLGEFDQEKYAFMVSVTNKLFNKSDNYLWNYTDLYNNDLRNLLNQFNAANPGAEKQFTFPVISKQVWWDTQKRFLGDFSEDKHAFIKDILGSEELTQSMKLEYWNLIFRDEVDKQGIVDFQFPSVTDQSSWWKNSLLGDFSVEKQEFVVRTLFPLSYYQITDETWTYGNVILRSELDKYNKANPGKPLNFEFPVEGRPDWWDFRERELGEYTPIKRDIAVIAVFEEESYWGDYNINPLIDKYSYFENALSVIRDAVNDYNAMNPDKEPIELPVVAPGWWNESILGEFSTEKENFMSTTMSKYGAYYNEWAQFEQQWNPVFRAELEEYNAANPSNPLEFTFPVVDIKWSYWDNHAFLGDYSEAKKVFVVKVLTPIYWGSIDDWALGTYSKNCYNSLVSAYDEYNATHADPLPFTFPDTFPN